MASDVDIVNIGLATIGEDTITVLDGQQLRQVLAKLFYAPTRRALLTEIDWHFAETTQNLARDVTTPVDDRYTYSYALPTDPVHLKTLRVSPGEDYKRQANSILSNATSLQMTYTADVAEDLMPAYFVMLLGLKMATLLAIPLTKKQTRLDEATALYERQLIKAEFADASQQPPEEVHSSPFIDVRY